MSTVFSELRRSERILPVDDKLFLQRVSAWRVLFLDAQAHPALYERVVFFRRDQQRRSRWMHTVRSSRVAMRQVPFVRPAAAAEAEGDAGRGAEAVRGLEQHRQRAALLAQCERRLCPALLHSPVGPAAALRLSRTAARLSLPAQAVALFVSATVAYFDAALAAMSPQPQSFAELVEAITQQCVRRLLDPCDSDAPAPLGQQRPKRRRSPFRVLLDAALSLWQERRAACVTASAPLGALAAPLRLRDVHSAAPTRARVFAPAVPRDLPRAEHPLRLAPLAPDPLLAAFLPAWDRWLRAARRDPAAVAALLDPAHAALDAAPLLPPPQARPARAALADFVCRAGAALWAAQDPGRCVVLTRAQAQFVMAAVEREFLATALRLRERGVQELRVRRAGAEALMLTVICNDGREAEIGRPAGLAAGRTALGDAGQSAGGAAAEAPLWLVASGGLEAAQTFLRHFLCGTRALEQVEDTRVVALTRAEEGVLHHIFQCHPAHFALAGCGVARLLLRAGDGQPLLQCVCSAALAEWELSDCYDPNDTSRLRRPVHAVPAQAESAGEPVVPLPRGVAPGRVGLSEVRGMVRHYWHALLEERRRGSDVEKTALFSVDAAVALYVLRHHPQFLTRIRGCGVAEVVLRLQRIAERGAAPREENSGVRGDPGEIEEVRGEEFGPTLAVTHPCGMWTAFDYEECYQPVTARMNCAMVLEGWTEDTWAQTPLARKRPYRE